jgi:hypothetical protein
MTGVAKLCCHVEGHRGHTVAECVSICVLQEMDGEPAPVDERSDEEIVQGFLAQLWALQRRPAASCSAGAASDCSPSANVAAASDSQTVSESVVWAIQMWL